ncbi:hypothetical protein [Photobacterium andalusiense]|uniref:Dystroglycan-type cadherin-like domain-containing protein n=1 Tax=Photobacterium andalusiense TaxID=2204296 RepID=A0A1Y6MJV6_9GAMM|nr:hypothetical protein [Photobacterium andalusiense]SMY36877.1 hypothetical protein PAND9192_02830 [Photobacterium andalusiense]
MQFKLSLLTGSLLAALALIGCDSDSSSDSNANIKPPVTPSETVTIKAIDGYLVNAEVKVDADGDASNGCELPLGTTTAGGEFNLPIKYQNNQVCIAAIEDKTIDEDRGIVATTFDLTAPAGSTVVTPMTNLVVEVMTANNELTAETAQAEVIKTLTDNGLEITTEQAFGDFIKDTSIEAKKISIIAESLTDNNDKTLEQQLEITSQITVQIKDKDDSTLEDFAPEITITDNGEAVVTENYRPTITKSLTIADVELNAAITDIDLNTYFEDKDVLTYTIKVKNAENKTIALTDLGLTETNNILSGTARIAGIFTLYITANDGKVNSHALTSSLTVTTPNTAPTVNNEVEATLQQQLKDLTLTQGENITNANIAITDLFNDVDGDELTITATTTDNGIVAKINTNNELVLTGTPTKQGELTLTLTATDGINDQAATATFVTTVLEAITPPPPEVTHPLVGKTWYVIEEGTNGDQFSQTWCNSVRFDNGSIYFNDRTVANRNKCSDAATIGGSYEIVEGTIKVQSGSDALAYNVVSDMNVSLPNTQVVTLTEGEYTERYTYFEKQSDAEKRLNIASNGGPEVRDIPAILPAMTEDDYQLGMYSVQMSNDGQMNNVALWLDSDTGFSCDNANEFYRHFVLTSATFNDSNGISGMCNNVTEDEITNAVINFAVPSDFKLDENYSLIGYVNSGDKALLENIKLNLIWKGEGNQE